MSMAPAQAQALRLVDEGGAPPTGLDTDALTALAWALKDLCYAAWRTEPQRAARAADALGGLADLAPGHAEVAALAHWTGGIADVARGQMADAAAAFDRAADGFRRLGLPGPAAQTQVPKIMALSMLGQHDAAADCAVRTQRALRDQGDVAAASRVSLNLGSLHLRHERYADAARHYREAAVLFARVNDREHSVMADIGLADALAALGELDEAERTYARARARSQAHDLPVLQALVDESVALLALSRGHYGDALSGFESARGRYQRLGMPQHLAIAEKQLADAYLELRLLPEALALFGTALDAFEALDMPDDRAWTLAQRGRTQALLGLGAEAQASFESAAALFARQGLVAGQAAVALARAQLALVNSDRRTGDGGPAALDWVAEAARGYAQAGLAEGSARAETVRCQALLACGRWADAHAAFDAALQRARADQRVSMQVQCLSGRGLAAQHRGDEAAARADFDAAIALFEDQRRALPGDELRSAFLADHLQPYRALLGLALAAHARDPGPDTAAQALWQCERVRARVLGDRLAGEQRVRDHGATAQTDSEAGADPDADGDPGLDSLRARCHWLLRRVQGLHDEDTAPSAALVDDLRRTEQALMERSRRARLARPQADSAAAVEDGFSVAALQQVLADGDALVAYGVLDGELFAWVVQGEDLVLHRHLAAWPEVLDALRAARFQLEALGHGARLTEPQLLRLTERCQARMARLHALVWAPFASRLAGAARVLVVAPAELGSLPFAALHDGHGPLGERHALALAPSVRTALHGLRRRPLPARRALVLAESSRLVHARAEVQQVAARFAAVRSLVDGQATLAALRAHAGEADVIHLACHALFRSDNPAFSALHLHDGALTAEQAETLVLRPGLVVLSGCDTARASGGGAGGGQGGASGGDEMVGLVRAFLVAGAARVVASLWPVDDAVTDRFMMHFYGAISRGLAPSEALRLAQAAVRAHHPHPFYWAAFAVYGGW